MEIFAINNLSDNDWQKSIVEYLKNLIRTTDQRFNSKELNYVIMGKELVKNNPEEILFKFLSEREVYMENSNVYSGSYGAHQVDHKMKFLIFRRGLYLPSMLKNCIEFAKRCQEFQEHVDIQHVLASVLNLIVKPWPFTGWALDLIGEI